jgi:thioredoxin-related protein
VRERRRILTASFAKKTAGGLNPFSIRSAAIRNSRDTIMATQISTILFMLALAICLVGCGRSMLRDSELESMDRRNGPALGRLDDGGNSMDSNSGAHAWQENYASALYEAETSNKMVLAFFTGSDWCTWCKKLEREVLSKPEFATWSADRFVLLKVDYPRASKQPENVMVQNRELADRYAEFVHGYPTVLFLDTSGEVLGQMGYAAGGPDAWIQKASRQLPPAG